jgi:uncharacterized protein (TIGR03067 family)
MYTSMLLGLAVTVGAPAVKDPPKKDPSIVGTWAGEKAVSGGQEKPVPKGGIEFIFGADGTFTVREGTRGPKGGATYKIDTKKKPAEIDIIPPTGKDEPTVPGIFKIEGDTLTMCIARDGKDSQRPKAFESPEGAQTMLMIFKRVKE